MTSDNSKVIASAMQSKKSNKRKTTEQFIAEAVAVHGNKYEYSLVVYVNAHTKVKIICPIHGVFEQTPIAHTIQKGCRKCSGNVLKTTEQFVADAIKIHGRYYNYEKTIYVSAKSKVIITCPKHGDFEQTPNQHTGGKGCYYCGKERRAFLRRSNIDDVVSRFVKAHGDKYDYSQFKYSGMLKKGVIICPEHGSFLQEPVSHIKGHGCELCARMLTGTHKMDEYVKNCELRHDGISNLYVIECSLKDEIFYKVGITVGTVEKRFQRTSIPYEINTVYLVKSNASFVWQLEKTIHRLLSKYKYQPRLKFNGHTECFSHIPKEVIKFLDSLEKSNQMQLIA